MEVESRQQFKLTKWRMTSVCGRGIIMNTDITKQMEMVLYRTEDDNVTVSALIKDETIWLTQKAMAELFGIDKSGISRHLAKIFEMGELDEEVVVAKIATTTQHGAMQDKTQTNTTNYYNLDAIISVGYRVNSVKATKFRIWATSVLKEYMQKGFVMDDERLKQGKTAFGKDYFRELLERVRSIRASERRIWQQITDVFAECSIDYDKNSEITYRFYATVQNKFHYAITGRTAAEIIYDEADHTKENMGLTTWKNAHDGRILKSDTSIAKNYLNSFKNQRTSLIKKQLFCNTFSSPLLRCLWFRSSGGFHHIVNAYDIRAYQVGLGRISCFNRVLVFFILFILPK
jgi:hypothetical protein